jgi:hypothetical protein
MEKVLGLAAVGILMVAAVCTDLFQNVGKESPRWMRVIAYSSFAITGLVMVWLFILFVFIK